VSSGNTKLRAARKGASFPVAVAAVQAGDAAPTEDGLDLHVLETLVATVLSPAQQREEQARQTRRMIRAQCLTGSVNTPMKLAQKLVDLVKGINGIRIVQLAHEDEVAVAAGNPRVQVRLCCRGCAALVAQTLKLLCCRPPHHQNPQLDAFAPTFRGCAFLVRQKRDSFQAELRSSRR